MERINSAVRKGTKLNQWRSTNDPIQWFKDIEKKKSKRFIKFDIVNFYPSISEELFKAAINWAKQFCDITPDEEEIIIKSKDSILYDEGVPWLKKGASNFDIGQGSFDGAESAELVGLLLLSEVAKISRINVGLYRDDGLAVSAASPRQNENISKEISKIFQNSILR